MNIFRKTGFCRKICLVLVFTLLLLTSGLLWCIPAEAVSSEELLSGLSELREKQAALEKKSAALAAEISENQKQAQSVIDQKYDIDRQIALSDEAIENYNAQLQQYSLLIAQKQQELEAALEEEAALQTQYKARLRSMEETGSVSYWSILFKASSFSDLLDRVDMIQEIAKSDQLMMQKLAAATTAVEQSREALEQQRQQMQLARTALAEQETLLAQQRAEADTLLLEIAEQGEQMTAEYQEYLDQEAALSSEVAKAEKAYYEALAAEEAARLAELNKKNNYVSTDGGASGFLYPLPYQVAITDSYGYRTHPVTGEKGKWHNGVDFAAGSGTAIYATKSGTVTTALDSSIWGNYVVINHGDGFSSLYAHMQGLIVSVGDYVKQGQVIGYVGSTGLSTGPHLHFTIYYNGADVNPMNYVG